MGVKPPYPAAAVNRRGLSVTDGPLRTVNKTLAVGSRFRDPTAMGALFGFHRGGVSGEGGVIEGALGAHVTP